MLRVSPFLNVILSLSKDPFLLPLYLVILAQTRIYLEHLLHTKLVSGFQPSLE